MKIQLKGNELLLRHILQGAKEVHLPSRDKGQNRKQREGPPINRKHMKQQESSIEHGKPIWRPERTINAIQIYQSEMVDRQGEARFGEGYIKNSQIKFKKKVLELQLKTNPGISDLVKGRASDV